MVQRVSIFKIVLSSPDLHDSPLLPWQVRCGGSEEGPPGRWVVFTFGKPPYLKPNQKQQVIHWMAICRTNEAHPVIAEQLRQLCAEWPHLIHFIVLMVPCISLIPSNAKAHKRSVGVWELGLFALGIWLSLYFLEDNFLRKAKEGHSVR